jgi:pantoate kinase
MSLNNAKQLLLALAASLGMLATQAVAQEVVDPQKVAQRLQEVAVNLQKQPSPEQLMQVQQLVLQLQLVQAQLPQQLELMEQLTKRHAQLTDLFQTLNQSLINKGLTPTATTTAPRR